MGNSKEIHRERQELADGIEELIANKEVDNTFKLRVLEKLESLNEEYHLVAQEELKNIRHAKMHTM